MDTDDIRPTTVAKANQRGWPWFIIVVLVSFALWGGITLGVLTAVQAFG